MDINTGSNPNSNSGNLNLSPQGQGGFNIGQPQPAAPFGQPGQAPAMTGVPSMGGASPVGVVSLSKGSKVSLSKTDPTLDEMMVGLGWDTNKFQGQAGFDLDVMVFMLTANEKVKDGSGMVFYNNPRSAEGSVVHSGDNRTGDGDGDDETVMVHLSQIPADITKIVFTVSIFDAANRSQNFGQVNNAFIRLVNSKTGAEVIRYDLSEDYSIETVLLVGELYRHNGDWKFSAVGSGWTADIVGLCSKFGLQVG